MVKNYIKWLMKLVNAKPRHYDLFETMFGVEFTYFVGNDINRAHDGLALRDMYMDDTGFHELYDILDNEPCSVIEMLVALAIRMADLMHDADVGDKTGHYFWLMIDNLGVKCTTLNEGDRANIVQKCLDFCDRKYDQGGTGGILVVQNPPKDMRKVEIWCQANWYLTEEYFENQ